MPEVKNLWLCDLFVCLFGMSKEVASGYLLSSMLHILFTWPGQMLPKSKPTYWQAGLLFPLWQNSLHTPLSLAISSSITRSMSILQMRLCAAF